MELSLPVRPCVNLYKMVVHVKELHKKYYIVVNKKMTNEDI